MYCPNCGAKCKDGSKFCQKCGSTLMNPKKGNVQDVPKDNQTQKKKFPKAILFAILGVAVVWIVIFLVMSFGGEKSKYGNSIQNIHNKGYIAGYDDTVYACVALKNNDFGIVSVNENKEVATLVSGLEESPSDLNIWDGFLYYRQFVSKNSGTTYAINRIKLDGGSPEQFLTYVAGPSSYNSRFIIYDGTIYCDVQDFSENQFIEMTDISDPDNTKKLNIKKNCIEFDVFEDCIYTVHSDSGTIEIVKNDLSSEEQHVIYTKSYKANGQYGSFKNLYSFNDNLLIKSTLWQPNGSKAETLLNEIDHDGNVISEDFFRFEIPASGAEQCEMAVLGDELYYFEKSALKRVNLKDKNDIKNCNYTGSRGEFSNYLIYDANGEIYILESLYHYETKKNTNKVQCINSSGDSINPDLIFSTETMKE